MREAVWISLLEFLDVRLGDPFEVETTVLGECGQIPEHVAKLLPKVVDVVAVAVPERLLDHVRHLPSLAGQSERHHGEVHFV